MIRTITILLFLFPFSSKAQILELYGQLRSTLEVDTNVLKLTSQLGNEDKTPIRLNIAPVILQNLNRDVERYSPYIDSRIDKLNSIDRKNSTWIIYFSKIHNNQIYFSISKEKRTFKNYTIFYYPEIARIEGIINLKNHYEISDYSFKFNEGYYPFNGLKTLIFHNTDVKKLERWSKIILSEQIDCNRLNQIECLKEEIIHLKLENDSIQIIKTINSNFLLNHFQNVYFILLQKGEKIALISWVSDTVDSTFYKISGFQRNEKETFRTFLITHLHFNPDDYIMDIFNHQNIFIEVYNQ